MRNLNWLIAGNEWDFEWKEGIKLIKEGMERVIYDDGVSYAHS